MSIDFGSEVIDFIRINCKGCGFQTGIRGKDGFDIRIANLKTAIKFHRPGDDGSESKEIHPDDPPALIEDYRLIHIWEDQWVHEQDKIRSRIRSVIGLTNRIYGRETKVVNLNNDRLKAFLDKNHLNIPLKAKYKYGLEYRDELVAVMSFSRGRKMYRDGEFYNSFELLRFCNKLNTTVVGGFGKLLNHFITQIHPDDIMTYVDADWSDGKYLKLFGFQFVGYKKPLSFWLNAKTGKRVYPHKMPEQHGTLAKSGHDNADKGKYILNNVYLKVYNSGSYKYILKLK
ncbi:MAG: hypothetical protein MI975_12290 [Cytophagales bacterium]|nr:hypothetical protein [Cytophagales bacterium]